MRSPDRDQHQIAIVAGGASGTLLAVHLLRHAATRRLPLHIKLVDQHGRHGLGQAYSTEDPAHQLNAMVGQMSAISGDPDHLLRWAVDDASSAGARPPGSGDIVTTSTFLARQDYGRYLLDTLAEAERAARPFGRLTRLTSEVLTVRRARVSPLSPDLPRRSLRGRRRRPRDREHSSQPALRRAAERSHRRRPRGGRARWRD